MIPTFSLSRLASQLRTATMATCLATAVIAPSISSAEVPTEPPSSMSETIKVRQKYFGFENVDALTGNVRSDRVIISWLTTTTFAVAANGKVFFLDAYLFQDLNVTAPARKRTPTTLQEMVDARPEWIFIGHGHGDHADYAANIAYRTGAKVFGAAEHCSALQVDTANQFGDGAKISCTAVIPEGAPIGTQVLNMPDLKPALCLNVIRHLHGATVPPDPELPPMGIEFTDGEDPREKDIWGEGPAMWPDVRTVGKPGGDLTVMYHFTVPGENSFSFASYDSVGPWKENAPELGPLLSAFPATDVLLGAVSGGNTVNNGLRDAALYIKTMQPKVFVPTHHDQSQIRRGAAGNSGEFWSRKLKEALGYVGVDSAQQPEIRWLNDASDYARPAYLTFDPASARWSKAGGRANPVCN